MKKSPWFIGRRAEKQAERFLKKLGYLIVERNVFMGRDELDLIAVHKETVVFVEVRYRIDGLESAQSSVFGSKSQRLKRAVSAYRSQENLWQVDCRIDVIAVTRSHGKWIIAHVLSAY